MSAALSQDAREALAYKLYIDLLGRKPSKDERLMRAAEIDSKGLTYVQGAVYESKEAADFRKRRGW